jgi:hypothetical protein
MSTALALHHVGEVVLRGLLARLAADERLGDVSCKLHDACNLASVLQSAGVQGPLGFAVNAPLAPVPLNGKNVLFDGAHGVDVLCHGGSGGLAIEAKLGFDRLSAPTFTSRFLGGLGHTAHSPPRVKGGMTAILNHRCLDGCALHLRTQDPGVALVAPWFLVVRRATWDRWNGQPPSLVNAHVAVFEEIVTTKTGNNEAAFDQLVAETLGSGFYKAWKIGE